MSPTDDSDLVLIRKEMESWDVKIDEDDGYPQFICSGCVLEFQRLFKFRSACIEVQAQWRHFYKLRQENNIQIKTEEFDHEDAEKTVDFIYVDDLSDCEYNNNDNDTSLDIKNVPIIDIDTQPIETLDNNTSTSEQKAIVAKDLKAEPQVAKTEKYQPQQMADLNKTVESSSTNVSVNCGIQCRVCMYEPKSAEQLQQHMQRIHDVKDWECHICSKKFKNATAKRLRFHLKWHKLSRHIKCAQCGFFCNSRNTLREHTRAMHTKIECKICGKRILSKKIHTHMRMHEFWSCSYCNECFDTKEKRELHHWQMHTEEAADREQLEQHVKNRHPVDENIHQQLHQQDLEHYNVSELMQPDKSAVEHAVQRQQDAERSTSSASSSVCESDDSDNKQNKTSRETIEKFVCAQCLQAFEKLNQLRKHYSTHSQPEVPQFSCHICSKKFDLKFSLNRHLKKHKKAPF